jgi:hypothetical protein
VLPVVEPDSSSSDDSSSDAGKDPAEQAQLPSPLLPGQQEPPLAPAAAGPSVAPADVEIKPKPTALEKLFMPPSAKKAPQAVGGAARNFFLC